MSHTAAAPPQEANLLDMKNAGVEVTSTQDWAVSLAVRSVTPGALGTLVGVGLSQGVNAAGAGMNQAVSGIANFFSGAGAALTGGSGGGASPSKSADGGGAGSTPDKAGSRQGADSGTGGD